MTNKLTHFAIHTDNIERAKNFYGEVFNWGFNSYGPPDFLQIKSGKSDKGELIGALQSRNYSPVKEKIIGLECTIGVEDIDTIAKKVEANGGEILMPKTAIPYVGWIIKFLDTEGNLVCAMQADPSARPQPGKFFSSLPIFNNFPSNLSEWPNLVPSILVFCNCWS